MFLFARLYMCVCKGNFMTSSLLVSVFVSCLYRLVFAFSGVFLYSSFVGLHYVHISVLSFNVIQNIFSHVHWNGALVDPYACK